MLHFSGHGMADNNGQDVLLFEVRFVVMTGVCWTVVQYMQYVYTQLSCSLFRFHDTTPTASLHVRFGVDVSQLSCKAPMRFVSAMRSQLACHTFVLSFFRLLLYTLRDEHLISRVVVKSYS